MKKNNRKWMLAILLIVLLLGGLFFLNKNISEISEDGFIKVRMYDANGNPISASPLSVVGGTPGVAYIDLTVTAVNSGSKVLSCQPIVTVGKTTPDIFASNLPTTVKTVPITGSKKASWTSNPFPVASLESATPVRFLTTIRCSYNTGSQTITLNDTVGYIDLSINQELEGSFTVQVNTFTGPNEYCGDTFCNQDETASTCADDCAVSLIPNTKFRTTNVQYASGAVGYTNVSGSTLTAFGYSTSSGSLSGTCAVKMGLNGYCGNTTLVYSNLPGGYVTGGANASLWKVTGSSTMVCICDDSGSTYKAIKFLTTDSEASLLDTSALSFDSSKELVF